MTTYKGSTPYRPLTIILMMLINYAVFMFTFTCLQSSSFPLLAHFYVSWDLGRWAELRKIHTLYQICT